MVFFERVKGFIRSLDTREFYRFIGIIFGIVFLILSLLVYRYYSSVQQLHRKLRRVNEQRQETRSILEKNEEVLLQRSNIEALLEQTKNFKIKEFFSSVLQELQLTALSSKEPDISQKDLIDGYVEIQLEASFSGMNTRQLAELLYKLEQNERVYIKDLKIVKALKAPTIDVSLVIATFEATATAQ